MPYHVTKHGFMATMWKKKLSSQWVRMTSIRPEKKSLSRSNVLLNVLLIVFFLTEGAQSMMSLFLTRSDSQFKVLLECHEAFERSSMKKEAGWIHKQTMNATQPQCTYAQVTAPFFLAMHAMTPVPQPPYSPYMTHAHFLFVPKVEIHPYKSSISNNCRKTRIKENSILVIYIILSQKSSIMTLSNSGK